MALYAIGDLHLALSLDKPMDVFGEVWRDHPQKLEQGFESLTEEDLCVLCGYLSWGMNLEEAREDFHFIQNLPGKKIIVKGNHDYWWSTATKAKSFFQEQGFDSLDILHNNCFFFGDYALCGTRGWFFEEEKGVEHDKKIMRREVMRLETSLKAAGDRQKLVFLHYPPIYQTYTCQEILTLFKKYEVQLCCYGHIHGKGCQSAFRGWRDGTEYKLVSADYVHFTPAKLL